MACPFHCLHYASCINPIHSPRLSALDDRRCLLPPAAPLLQLRFQVFLPLQLLCLAVVMSALPRSCQGLTGASGECHLCHGCACLLCLPHRPCCPSNCTHLMLSAPRPRPLRLQVAACPGAWAGWAARRSWAWEPCCRLRLCINPRSAPAAASRQRGTRWASWPEGPPSFGQTLAPLEARPAPGCAWRRRHCFSLLGMWRRHAAVLPVPCLLSHVEPPTPCPCIQSSNLHPECDTCQLCSAHFFQASSASLRPLSLNTHEYSSQGKASKCPKRSRPVPDLAGWMEFVCTSHPV